MSMLTVGLLQIAAASNDQAANLANGEAACRRAKQSGADIALFPEMFGIGCPPAVPLDPHALSVYRSPERWTDQETSSPPAEEIWRGPAVSTNSLYVRHFRGLARELDMAIALAYLQEWPGLPRNAMSLIDRHGKQHGNVQARPASGTGRREHGRVAMANYPGRREAFGDAFRRPAMYRNLIDTEQRVPFVRVDHEGDLVPGRSTPPSSPHHTNQAGPRIDVPEPLAASLVTHFGDAGRAWIASVPDLIADYLDRWSLRLDGPPRHGSAGLVVPVLRADSVPAALKLQPVEEDSIGSSLALRTWDGNGAVRLLEASTDSSGMLLERLNPDRSLSSVEGDLAALQILAELLARLSAVAAPDGLRTLTEIAAAMLDQVPHAMTRLSDPTERQLVKTCASMVDDVLPEAGDRLLHWDLHYDNILAPHHSDPREPWLAIDPAPLAGDPGFELLPALGNRWDDLLATGDLPRALRRRFDLMTEVLVLERQRATAWTAGRVLQNILWDVESGQTRLHSRCTDIAQALLTDR